ncbi:hypothetical protein WYO_5218 [Methylobacterium sp. GXF4]|uniref:hypothetical protein n=1 Tax=Methylobacterium sp. GXF4 TaxID=1096546 RepID=UPI00026996E8|nr:hypothetical protein [Methylobacterium sp. GXF4]EIZ82178.1 hypothetical protein WYO_5218 [Methylobacterium sp. GXF4]
MSHRTVFWNTLSRSLHDSRPAIAPGLLSAKARIDMTVRTTRRPLFDAGQFDRGAIMSAARHYGPRSCGIARHLAPF